MKSTWLSKISHIEPYHWIEFIISAEDPLLYHFPLCPGIYIFLWHVEGGFPMDHFIEEDPESPDIQFFIVSGPFNHFWGEVLLGATKGISDVIIFSWPPKVGELDPLIRKHQKIFWFEIPVENGWVSGVHVLDRSHYVVHQLCALFLWKLSFQFHFVEETAVSGELHEHVYVAFVRKYLLYGRFPVWDLQN